MTVIKPSWDTDDVSTLSLGGEGAAGSTKRTKVRTMEGQVRGVTTRLFQV